MTRYYSSRHDVAMEAERSQQHHQQLETWAPHQRSRRFREQFSLPPHVLGQKLNNKGAAHLENGNFERAIFYFAKALPLAEETVQSSKQQQMHSMETCTNSTCCTCPSCQLEQCMVASSINIKRKRDRDISCFSSSSRHPFRMRVDAPPPPSMRKGIQNSSFLALSSIHDGIEEGEQPPPSNVWKGGYLYSEPLLVSPIAIKEHHQMGVTLSLIVLFNLALSYQLSAASMADNGNVPIERCFSRLKKSRQLYELCYQLQLEECPQSSLRFTMCIANNLAEIHRVEGNMIKYDGCLQHLLSTMMYMVDCQMCSPASQIRNNGRGNPNIQSQSMQAGAVTTITSINEAQQVSEDQQYYNEWLEAILDGFFRNTSKIILRDQVAPAA